MLIKTATVTNTEELGYRNGYVRCACGWQKDLGDGFNGYTIDVCPKCTPALVTRDQSKVTVGTPGNYTVTEGHHIYFAMSNGIHIQYSAQVRKTYRSY